MSRIRSLSVGALAGLAVAALVFLRVGAAEQKAGPPAVPPGAEATLSLPLGQTVTVRSTGGTQLTGQLVARDRDWLLVKVGEAKLWLGRAQVISIQHPAPAVSPPPPPPPAG